MKYLLLNPLTFKDFNGEINTADELRDALEEFGCDFVVSMAIDGTTKFYITAPTKEALGACVTAVDLDGAAVEYTGFFDQYKE